MKLLVRAVTSGSLTLRKNTFIARPDGDPARKAREAKGDTSAPKMKTTRVQQGQFFRFPNVPPKTPRRRHFQGHLLGSLARPRRRKKQETTTWREQATVDRRVSPVQVTCCRVSGSTPASGWPSQSKQPRSKPLSASTRTTCVGGKDIIRTLSPQLGSIAKEKTCSLNGTALQNRNKGWSRRRSVEG